MLLTAAVSPSLHGSGAVPWGKGLKGAISLHGGSAGENLVGHQDRDWDLESIFPSLLQDGALGTIAEED